MVLVTLTSSKWLWQKPLEETEAEQEVRNWGHPCAGKTLPEVWLSREIEQRHWRKEHGRLSLIKHSSLPYHPQERSMFHTPLMLGLNIWHDPWFGQWDVQICPEQGLKWACLIGPTLCGSCLSRQEEHTLGSLWMKEDEWHVEQTRSQPTTWNPT